MANACTRMLRDRGLVEATENYNVSQRMKNTAPESGVKFLVWENNNGIEEISERSRKAIEQRGDAIAENETDLAFHISRALNSKEQQTVFTGGIRDSVISKMEGLQETSSICSEALRSLPSGD